MSGTPEFSIVRDGAIATLTIQREAARNALTLALVDEMQQAVRTLHADRTLRVMIVRGGGTKAFSAGFDIGAIEPTIDIAADGSVDSDRRLDAAFRAFEEAPFVVIAAIHGHCIGGGFELALACDLRIAADDAQFRMPPARLGWVYGLANLQRFVAAMGPGRARYTFLTASTLDAARALDWGVAHEVMPKAELEGRVSVLAADIAAAAPIALTGLKQGIAALARANLREPDLAGHVALRRQAFSSADLQEGRAAFLARRPPRFRGC